MKSGTLWESTTRRTREALDAGVLQPIPTRWKLVEQNGVGFLVRIVSNLERKAASGKQQSETAGFNPFLHYPRKLFVADLSETHLCLLNRFNVIDHHLLIVTRSFEDQEAPLTLADFEALWIGMAEFEGLGFYNAGKIAGASQRHKHLQLVPLPLVPGGAGVPVEPLLEAVRFEGELGRSPSLPFVHAVARVDPIWISSPRDGAAATLDCYRAMLGAVGCRDGPYNLLVTRRWMLLVPRSREHFQSISVNGLGFAGALLVRNEHELDALERHGPMSLLRTVALARTIHEPP